MATSGGARGALLFTAGAVALLVSLVVAGNLFPRRVAIHFNLSGEPDEFLSRADALVLMSIIGLTGGLIFGLLAAGASRIPIGMFNVPDRDWWAATPERETELRRRMRSDMFGFGGVFLMFVAALTLMTLRASRMAEPHLDAWFVALIVGFALLVIGWVLYLVRVRYRASD